MVYLYIHVEFLKIFSSVPQKFSISKDLPCTVSDSLHKTSCVIGLTHVATYVYSVDWYAYNIHCTAGNFKEKVLRFSLIKALRNFNLRM